MEAGKNAILEKSFEFAIQIIAFSELLEEKRKYVIARQLLKSGTSIGANVREAQAAESLVDFIHKMKIAAKEADETEYWLLLCQQAKNYPDPIEMFERNHELIKLLTSIISKSKSKLNSPKPSP
jgi:four helix bundle protein